MWSQTTTTIDPSSSILIHDSPLSSKSCRSTGEDSLDNFMLSTFSQDVAALDNSIIHSDAGKPQTSHLMIPDLKSSTTNPFASQQQQRKHIHAFKLQQPITSFKSTVGKTSAPPQAPSSSWHQKIDSNSSIMLQYDAFTPTTISFKSTASTMPASPLAPSSALLQKIGSNSSIMLQYDGFKNKKSAAVSSFATKIKTERKKAKTKKTTATTAKSVVSCSSSSTSGGSKKKRSRQCPKDQYTQVSYENKIQKAKDNRAKLTEAINLLESAFRQARSGSEQRSQTYKEQKLSLSSSSQDSMNDVIQTAMNSHKWDRPSFIMSAADIVMKLNEQCQALMEDALELKKQNSHNSNNNIHVKEQYCYNSTETNNADRNKQSCNVRTLQGNNTSGCGVGQNNSYSSSQLIGGMNNTVVQMETMFQGSTVSLLDVPESIIKEIANFLDPKSLLRCRQVTKLWNNFDNSADIFTHDDLWLDLCTHRYGSSQVQKWKDTKDNYCTARETPMSGNTVNHVVKNGSVQQHYSAMKMYRDMNAINWKPSFSYNQGDLYLGDAKMNYNNLPVLSAWGSIVVRSNGETMRTVFANLDASEQILLIPVVEVRILLQNTGFPGQNKGSVLIPEQTLSIESRGNEGEMFELQSDIRLTKRVIMRGKGGSSPILLSTPPPSPKIAGGGLCYLDLYEVAELRFHVHAPSCLSTKEFVDKAKSLKLLVSILGNTVPFHIPFQSQ